jgi:hypothetical protein
VPPLAAIEFFFVVVHAIELCDPYRLLFVISLAYSKTNVERIIDSQ